MVKQIKNALMIWICSVLLCGCSLTLGPQVEKKAIILKAGVPVEILEQQTLDCRVLTDKDGEVDVFRQDVGGWIAMHPDHWASLKAEMKRLKGK